MGIISRATVIAAMAMSVLTPGVTAGPTGSRALQWNDSTSLTVTLRLTAGDTEIKGNRRLVITPSIVGSDGHSLVLPQVEFAGRQNRKFNDRRALLAGEERTGVYGRRDTVDYVRTVAAEPWMLGTPLRLEVARAVDGCCDVDSLPTEVHGHATYVAPYVPAVDLVVPRLSVAEQMARHEPVLRPMDEYRPYDSSIPLRQMTGALYVHFRVNETVIDSTFHDNQVTLDKIVRMLSAIAADTASSVRRVVIIGLASPEGPLEYNNRLSQDRAKALRDYVGDRVDMTGVEYELVAAGEAWADLRQVVADSDLKSKDEVLAIIDSVADPTRREQLLRRLDGGEAFRYLSQEVFVDQRNSGYIQVYYDAKPDTPAMMINESSDDIRAGHYDAAIERLESLDDDRRWNTLGAAYYMAGRHDEARECFRRAAELGDADAARNLREMERRDRLQ